MADIPQVSPQAAALEARAHELAARVERLLAGLETCYFGARETLLSPLVQATLAGCHVLLEGVPGLGKTLLAKALATGLGGSFSRIQCTPDLMPSDVTGTEVLEEGDKVAFRFRKGPIFGNLVLADEINRATPKTQSALLEAMEEGRVTWGMHAYELPQPFNLIATQNPIEMEGTYPLPEAQLDRFALHLTVAYPDRATLESILEQRRTLLPALPAACLTPQELLEVRALSEQVVLGPHLRRFVAELLLATQPADGKGDGAMADVRLGASPRAGLSLVRVARMKALLSGRFHVSREDLEDLALPVLRHRVLLGFEARARRRTVGDLLPGWLEAARRAR